MTDDTLKENRVFKSIMYTVVVRDIKEADTYVSVPARKSR